MTTSIAMRPELSVAHVTVERSAFRALSDVTFNVRGGALVGILGPNGAGKSTLFDVIAGVLPATKGKVDFHGALAYVPQKDSINWRFPATVMDVVMLGRSGGNPLRRPGRQDRELVRNSLDRVGLWDRTLIPDDRTLRRATPTGIHRPGAGARSQYCPVGRGIQRASTLGRSKKSWMCCAPFGTTAASSCWPPMTCPISPSALTWSCASTVTFAHGARRRRPSPRRVLQELYGSHGMDFTQGHWHGRGMWHGHSHNMAEAETNGPA